MGIFYDKYVFFRYSNRNDFVPDYPEDFEKIVKYLQSQGKIKCSARRLQSLYRDYCDETASAGWLDVDEDVLARFAEWLNRQD